MNTWIFDLPDVSRCFGGGESGGHLLGSMLSTEEFGDDPSQAGSWCLGHRRKSKRAEGKEEKAQLMIFLPN